MNRKEANWQPENRPESMKLCRDPQPDRPVRIQDCDWSEEQKRLDMSHSDHFGIHGYLQKAKEAEATAEDHFENWIEPWDPHERSPGFRRRNSKWEEVKAASARRYYDEKRNYAMPIDKAQLRANVVKAVQHMNQWLDKCQGSYPEHPETAFIGFFKRYVREGYTVDKAVKATTVRLTYNNGFVEAITLYDTNWPHYAIEYLHALREIIASLNFRELSKNKGSIEQGMELSVTSISAAMAPGLSRLANYTF